MLFSAPASAESKPPSSSSVTVAFGLLPPRTPALAVAALARARSRLLAAGAVVEDGKSGGRGRCE